MGEGLKVEHTKIRTIYIRKMSNCLVLLLIV
jgi:hypothetical protein